MRLRGHAGWLVLVSAVACSVYDESLLTVSGTVGGAGMSGMNGGGSGGMTTTAGSAGTTASGGSASAGSGGSSGQTAVPAGSSGDDGGEGGEPPFVDQYELIDDMEDDDQIVLGLGDRNGRWVSNDDGTGTTTPTKTTPQLLTTELTGVDARDGSTRGVRFRAQNFSAGPWGAFVAVFFMYPDSTLYDASDYCGIHFWAKRSPDPVTTIDAIEVRVPDQYTIPAGGHCRDPEAAGGASSLGLCYDHHARLVQLTEQWEEYTIYFSQFLQGNWAGYEQSELGELDVSALTSIEFFLNKPDDYELWIDDLEFVRKPEGGDCP